MAVQIILFEVNMSYKILYFFLISLLINLLSCRSDFTPYDWNATEIDVPNDETILFQMGSDFGWRLGVSSSDYKKHFNLTYGPLDIMGVWSKDKNWIVYSRVYYDKPNNMVCRMDYNGKNKKILTSIAVDCQFPRLSSDNKFIFYLRYDGIKTLICRMDSSGKNHTVITDENYNPIFKNIGFTYYDVNTDKNIIICNYYTYGVDKLEMGLIDLETFKFTPLTFPNLRAVIDPRISPDGKEFLFTANLDLITYPKIFKAKIDGSSIIQLTTSFESREPCWSMDGQRIVYTNSDSLNAISTIWVMDKNGNNKRKVIDLGNVPAVSPAW